MMKNIEIIEFLWNLEVIPIGTYSNVAPKALR
jgi:hypothetical protein